MNKAAALFFISTFLTVASNSAQAFDGKRKGFQIGLGLGAHTSELNYSSNFSDNFPQAQIDSEQYVAVSLLLGYGFSNRIVGYLGGKASSVLINDRDASLGVSGFGVSLYLNEQSPSLYVTGLLGSASVSINDEPEEFNDKGDGWLVGVGYELTDRLHLEFSHARADLTEPANPTKKSTLESSFLTLQYNWY